MKLKILRRLSDFNMEHFIMVNPGIVSIKLAVKEEFKKPYQKKKK